MDDFIFRKMFGFREGADQGAVNAKIDETAEKLTLPDLLNFNAEKREKIVEVLVAIREREEKEGRRLNIREQIEMAAVQHGLGLKKHDTIKFDEEKLDQMINELHSDGRTLDKEPNSGSGGTVKRDSMPKKNRADGMS